MTDDRRKISKRRNLEDVKQNLYQAEAAGDKIRIKIWKEVLAKLLAQNAVKK